MSHISVIDLDKIDHGEYTELEENSLSQNNTINQNLKNSKLFKEELRETKEKVSQRRKQGSNCEGKNNHTKQ